MVSILVGKYMQAERESRKKKPSMNIELLSKINQMPKMSLLHPLPTNICAHAENRLTSSVQKLPAAKAKPKFSLPPPHHCIRQQRTLP